MHFELFFFQFKGLTDQAKLTLLLLRVRGSGSETTVMTVELEVYVLYLECPVVLIIIEEYIPSDSNNFSCVEICMYSGTKAHNQQIFHIPSCSIVAHHHFFVKKLFRMVVFVSAAMQLLTK